MVRSVNKLVRNSVLKLQDEREDPSIQLIFVYVFTWLKRFVYSLVYAYLLQSALLANLMSNTVDLRAKHRL